MHMIFPNISHFFPRHSWSHDQLWWCRFPMIKFYNWIFTKKRIEICHMLHGTAIFTYCTSTAWDHGKCRWIFHTCSLWANMLVQRWWLLCNRHSIEKDSWDPIPLKIPSWPLWSFTFLGWPVWLMNLCKWHATAAQWPSSRLLRACWYFIRTMFFWSMIGYSLRCCDFAQLFHIHPHTVSISYYIRSGLFRYKTICSRTQI